MEIKGWSVNKLLIVTSLSEGATGLALMITPSFVVNLLLGSPITDSIPVMISRIAGSILVSLAVASWFSRKSSSIKGLNIAILFYNLATAVLLGYAGLHENLNGMALWPAVVMHIAMTLWSARCLSFMSKVNSLK